MPKNLLRAVTSAAEERIKNPVIGTFVLVWFAVNWQAIAFFALSPKLIEEKLEIIKSTYSNPWTLYWTPILGSIVYLLFSPGLGAGYRLFLTKFRTIMIKADCEEKTTRYKEMTGAALEKKRMLDAEAGNTEREEWLEKIKTSELIASDLSDQLNQLRQSHQDQLKTIATASASSQKKWEQDRENLELEIAGLRNSIEEKKDEYALLANNHDSLNSELKRIVEKHNEQSKLYIDCRKDVFASAHREYELRKDNVKTEYTFADEQEQKSKLLAHQYNTYIKDLKSQYPPVI